MKNLSKVSFFQIRHLWLTLLLLLVGNSFAIADNVAKVGNTEYATIEEAVSAWGPGKTLTLLDNVTTSSTVTVEVNATKSTQSWTLNLGDYTWTASGCNALLLKAAGGTPIHQNYGLKINANQNGGITASGKYCIQYQNEGTCSDERGYRPRLEINGGTYKGSYIVYYGTYAFSSTANGASVFINKSADGTEPVFNGDFGLSKCPVTVNAGYFNGTKFTVYRVSSTVDPNLYGGHFKTYSAFPVPGNNKGIVFGNYKVFVKSDASIDVVNGAPAEYEAKATKTLLLSTNQAVQYNDYVFYEKANDAINKYSYGTIEIILSDGVTATQDKSFSSGTLTIDASAEGSAYTGNITLTGNGAKFIIKFPEGKGHYGVTASTGQLHVEESVADGIVTRTYSVMNVSDPEAKVGDTGYSTVYDAFYAIDGTTDNKTIVLQKDVTNAGIVTNGTATGGDGKTVASFDLNGHSIGIGSVACGNNADYTMTIIDSSEGKTGIVTNSDASLFILALTGISDYSGSYTLKIQAGTWQFNPETVVINGETHNLVDEGYYAKNNGNGTWTVGELPAVAKVGETKYPTLQSAVNAAKALGGAQTVTLLADISGETVTIPEVANFQLTIDGKKDAGSNYTVDALIIVDGLRGNGGSMTNGASVTLQNMAFTNGEARDVILASHYPHDLTIQDCTYTGSAASINNWFVNVDDGPLYGATIKNITVEHSRLIQLDLSSAVVFENIVATNDVTCGFNIKTSDSAGKTGTVLIKDCQVTTAKYAFRDYKDGYNGTITLEGNTFVSTSEAGDEGVIVNRGGAVGTAHVNVVSGTYTGHLKVLNNKEGVLALSGGYFSEEFPQDYIAADLVAQGKVCVPATDMEGYFTIGDPHYVAQIGETKYVSLQAALDAAHEMTGDVTIELIDDIEGYSIVRQKAGLNLTIDGKDKTLTGQIFIDGNGRLNDTETLTIQNMKFEGNTTNFYSGTDAFILVPSTKETGKPWSTGAYNYAHNITIYNCSFNSTSTSGEYDIVCFKSTSAAGAKNVNINNCTASGTKMHSLAQFTGTTGGSVTNCTVTGSESFVNVSGGGGEYTVSGNTFTSAEGADGYGIRENGSSTAVITLTDNTFTAANTVVLGKGNSVTAGTINVESGVYTGTISKTEAATGKIALSGGYFSEEFPQDYIAEDLVAQGKVCVPATDMEGYFTIGDPHYVAQIGETKYVTLAAAVAAVPADGTETTITMIDDETINSNEGVVIPVGKNVVLDLNGKTVKGVVQDPASAQTILNKGTLVITDSSDEKNGTITNEVSDENAGSPMDKNWYSNAITNNGTLTVNAGNIVNTGTGGACYAIDNITNGTLCSPVLNIAGGNISAKKVAVRMFCNSTTNDNTVNITGGVVMSENAYALQAQQANKSANKAKLNISGGTLSGQYAFCDYGDKNTATQFDNASYSITGGFFSGYMWSYATSYCGMDGFVSGGYFDNVVGGDIVAPGKACVDNTEEETKDAYPYTIGIADVHYYWLNNSGQIDGGGYYTIYAPFAGPDPVLMDGEFIELQKDVILTKDIEYLEECSFGDPIFKGGTFTLTFGDYTIDLNGYKFPLPVGVAVLTDKQTDIFSSLTEGYKVYEFKTETGYKYLCDHFEAECAGTYYKTFAEAAAVANGNVITLLDNISDTYPMSAGETLRVAKDGYTFNTPSAPDSYSVKYAYEGAITVYTLTAAENFASINGYFRIKNNGNNKYVNVLGRRTATVNTEESDAKSLAGTVIKVKSNELGQVEVLRSQAVDIPHYAERAMSYVPDFVRLVVDKLHVDGSGEILGATGVDAIMQKFNEEFDYHLYVENVEGGYRIFGRTPSMKPVVEFYYENKANVDAKLPGLEAAVNAAIDKVVDRIGRGESLRGSFDLHKIWVAMGGTLTEPTDEASKVAFLQEVLMSETNVWNFGYQTVMQYVNKVENSSYFDKMPAELKKYWNLAKQAHPDFKYYIVQKDGAMDFISEGNIDIIDNNARTIWTLEPVNDNFEVTIPYNTVNKDGDYFTTLYTDFGYQLPSGVTALKVIGIDADGVAQTEEIGSVVAAQTPVLLKTSSSGTINLTVGDFGSAVSGNELHGADYVINEYEINNSQLEGLFEIFKQSISSSIADDYEYLLRMNSGTVNNKYFFPLEVDGELSDAYKAKTGNEMNETPVHYLGVTEDGKLAFIKSWEAIPANGVYMFDETVDPIYLDKPEHPADIAEGYYRIKNVGNELYVNVIGRKTATVSTSADEAKTLAGTVLKVKATEGVVEILRSQAVDLPYYAQRAMSYVPDVVELVVNRLGVDGSGEILGSTGVQAILDKFNESFDYHLHVEYADDDEQNIRIYGKTPSMRPVVEFYRENKDKVDAKLPSLESEINEAIRKVVEQAGTGSVLLNSFSLETIWDRMGKTLTKPVDDATKLTFLQEVLQNEKNVWNFAYQTATFYMEKVEGSEYFDKIPAEIKKYWNLAKQVNPNFKYYIVQKDGNMDFISEGNIDILKKDGRTMWNLEPLNEDGNVFVVNIPEENSRLAGKDKKEYYTTVYTDFGYQLPEGVTALKVTEIKDVEGLGLAVTEEIGGVVAAQTPVLIKASEAGDITLTVGDFGTPVTDNLLHGADWLINEYQINNPTLVGLFDIFKGKISSSIADQYEYLLRRNSGTINNKYFFPLSIDGDLAPAYEKKMNVESMQNSPVRVLGKNNNGKFLAFYESWDNLYPNAVYIFSEDYKPVFLYLIGDVDRDEDFDLDDVNATIDIVLNRDTVEDNYDYEAADADVEYEKINLNDVNTLIDLVLHRISLSDIINKMLGE